MDAEFVWPVSSLLIDHQRLKHESEQGWICVEHDRMKGIDDIDRLDVAVARDLFEEELDVVAVASELQCTKSLSQSERSDCSIVVATSSARVFDNLGVESICSSKIVSILSIKPRICRKVGGKVAGP